MQIRFDACMGVELFDAVSAKERFVNANQKYSTYGACMVWVHLRIRYPSECKG